jgi:branched-chain amino acid transport system permease protein
MISRVYTLVRPIGLGIGALFMLLVPVFANRSFFMDIAELFFVFAILVASWDLLYGYTGQLNIGQTFPYAVAGYTLAALTTTSSLVVAHIGLSTYLAVPVGLAVAVGGGAAIVYPALRLRQEALVIVTLLIPVIFSEIFLQFWGEGGIAAVPNPITSGVVWYYVEFAAVALTYLSLYFLVRSRFGMKLKAIREDELAAEMSGINTTKYKALAFFVSFFFAGVAGVLYTLLTGNANPQMLSITLMFEIIAMVLVGGLGTLIGPLIGAFILTFLSSYLTYFSEYRLLVYAIALITVVLIAPNGLMSLFKGRGK